MRKQRRFQQELHELREMNPWAAESESMSCRNAGMRGSQADMIANFQVAQSTSNGKWVVEWTMAAEMHVRHKHSCETKKCANTWNNFLSMPCRQYDTKKALAVRQRAIPQTELWLVVCNNYQSH